MVIKPQDLTIEDWLHVLAEELRCVDIRALSYWDLTTRVAISTKNQQLMCSQVQEFYRPFAIPTGLHDKVKATIKAEGIRVIVRRMSTVKTGQASNLATEDGVVKSRSITISPWIDEGNKTSTMLHEWTHLLMHQTGGVFFTGRLARHDQEELEAEATAYVVGRMLGIHHKASPRYLAQYGINSLRLMQPRNVERITKAAEYMLARLGNCTNA